MSKTLYERLAEIQLKLKAPKSQYNKFGQYNYRNQEDILEAVKPLLKGLVLKLDDEVVQVGDKNYVKSIATISDGENSITATASARESESQKGMNDAQLTGSTSSYARKYALNGLFLIDDTKDADATNQHGKTDTSEGKPTRKARGSKVKDESGTTTSDDESKVRETEDAPTPSKTSFRRKRRG